jgi:hypothetical protein
MTDLQWIQNLTLNNYLLLIFLFVAFCCIKWYIVTNTPTNGTNEFTRRGKETTEKSIVVRVQRGDWGIKR